MKLNFPGPEMSYFSILGYMMNIKGPFLFTYNQDKDGALSLDIQSVETEELYIRKDNWLCELEDWLIDQCRIFGVKHDGMTEPDLYRSIGLHANKIAQATRRGRGNVILLHPCHKHSGFFDGTNIPRSDIIFLFHESCHQDEFIIMYSGKSDFDRLGYVGLVEDDKEYYKMEFTFQAEMERYVGVVDIRSDYMLHTSGMNAHTLDVMELRGR